VDEVGDLAVADAAEAALVPEDGQRLVHLREAAPLGRADQQRVARLERHDRAPGDAVHLEQAAVRRVAVVQAGVADDVVERRVRVAERLGVLVAPRVRRERAGRLPLVDVRDHGVAEAEPLEHVAVAAAPSDDQQRRGAVRQPRGERGLVEVEPALHAHLLAARGGRRRSHRPPRPAT
jgi:hypothetical protein